MATCLQVPMVVPSSFTLRSSSFDMNPKIGRRRNVINKKRLKNYRCSSSKIPFPPPLDPNDPFKQRLDDMNFSSSSEPEKVEYPPLPLIDFFTTPSMMPSASSSYGRGRGRGGGRGAHGDYEVVRAARRYYGNRELYGPPGFRTPIPPPDLASMYLDERIIYLGMPLVEAVTELIYAQFVYLQYVDDISPIYLYIDSTGTTRHDNELVATPADGMAIYDAMTHVENDVETVCLGDAFDYACLLVAAGKLGRRFLNPRSRIKMRAPPVAGTGLKPASFIASEAKEAELNTQLLYKLFAYHTGHRLDDIKEKLKKRIYMNAKEALEFGVADKIILQPDTRPEDYGLDLKPEQWQFTTNGINEKR